MNREEQSIKQVANIILRMQSLDVGQPISSCLIKTIFILNIVSSLCYLYRGLAELIFSVNRYKIQCILNHIYYMLWDKFNFWSREWIASIFNYHPELFNSEGHSWSLGDMFVWKLDHRLFTIWSFRNVQSEPMNSEA